MITLEDVIKQVSKNLDIDKEVVGTVCKHVFQHTVGVMKSDDTSDILFNEAFKFKLKRRFKEDKNRQYSK
jgi:hypothetical protein